METSLESINARVVVMGNALGQARAYEQRLEDERPLLKEMAIIRIMARDKINSTPAEKIVESDLEYMEHRVKQRGAVVARFKADAEYQVAKAALTQASLITPSMIELQTKIKKLELDLKVQKQERENAETGRANANSMLAGRIRDVDALQQRIRRFWAQIDLLAPRPLEVYDAWETSLPRRATALPCLSTPKGPHEQPGDVMAVPSVGV